MKKDQPSDETNWKRITAASGEKFTKLALCVIFVPPLIVGGVAIARHETWINVLGAGAAVVTILGAVVAVYTYALSDTMLRATYEAVTAHPDNSKLESASMTETDPIGLVDVIEKAESLRTFSWDGREIAQVRVEDIPLRVFGDLISRWRRFGSSGKFFIRDIEWCVRATGRGSFPWLIKFNGEDYCWRVAYGGKAKRERGTVTFHDVPRAVEIGVSASV